MTKGCRTPGFTLIELLVVIAIIAILAAILFPVFSKAREKARQTSCASNLRQIDLAFQMYTQDWDETYPLMSYDSGISATPMVYWFQALYPYVRNTAIFACPSDSSTTSFMPPDRYRADGIWLPDTLRNSYAFNYELSGKSLAVVASPSDMFLNWDASVSFDSTNNKPQTNSRYRPTPPRHSEGDNYACADGHVKWSSRAATPWNDPRFTMN